jgi:hypothetical protein
MYLKGEFLIDGKRMTRRSSIASKKKVWEGRERQVLS